MTSRADVTKCTISRVRHFRSAIVSSAYVTDVPSIALSSNSAKTFIGAVVASSAWRGCTDPSSTEVPGWTNIGDILGAERTVVASHTGLAICCSLAFRAVEAGLAGETVVLSL